VSEEKKAAPATSGGKFWAWFPVVLITSTTAGLVAMGVVASNDPSFSLEKDYYKKALRWDETQAQAAENARLGWKVELDAEPRGQKLELVARVRDSHGQPIHGAVVLVEGFPNARASQVGSTTLATATDGYRGDLSFVRPGVWEFRLSVDAGGKHYTEILRRDVRAGDAS